MSPRGTEICGIFIHWSPIIIVKILKYWGHLNLHEGLPPLFALHCIQINKYKFYRYIQISMNYIDIYIQINKYKLYRYSVLGFVINELV